MGDKARPKNHKLNVYTMHQLTGFRMHTSKTISVKLEAYWTREGAFSSLEVFKSFVTLWMIRHGSKMETSLISRSEILNIITCNIWTTCCVALRVHCKLSCKLSFSQAVHQISKPMFSITREESLLEQSNQLNFDGSMPCLAICASPLPQIYQTWRP